VYFIRQGDTNFYKIGFSASSVQGRVKSLQTGNPLPLHIAKMYHGDQKTEQFLHKRYKKKQGVGEWFEFKDGDCALLFEK
jgi:hypothetical protein